MNKTHTADGKRKRRAMWADNGAETGMKEVLETRGCLGKDCPFAACAKALGQECAWCGSISRRSVWTKGSKGCVGVGS